MKTFSPYTTIAAVGLLFTSQFAVAEQDIEVINVTYRSAIDYAVYQHTTETLAMLRLEVAEQIHDQARDSSLQMAKDLQYYSLPALTAQQVNKHIAGVWLSQAAE